MKKLTCQEVAEITGGTLVNPSKEIIIDSVASLEEAKSNQLTFLGNDKYAPQVISSKAGVILIPENFATPNDKCYVICKNPSAAFSQIIDIFAPEPIKFPPGIHPSAVIAEDATIGEGCHIAANVTILPKAKIGNSTVICAGTVIGHEAVIGDNCLLYPNVTVRERCVIGNRVIIHSGTAIGSDGFGFIPGAQGHKKIPQVGIVLIEDDVEIGSCVCIDRARFGTTKIGKGTKIDNLVQIAHNVEIGPHCFIVSQSGIAGSSKLGKFVIMAAQGGITGHVQVGDGVVMAGRIGVTKDIPAGEKVFGFPAVSKKEFVMQSVRLKKVDKLEQEINELKKALKELLEKK